MSVHVFDPQIAEEYGLVEAILIKNLQFWIEHNRANGRNQHDGRTWTWNSIRAYQQLFPYLGKKAIYNALKRLEADGVIVTGNYNDDPRNQTIWYAFADEERWVAIVRKGKSAISPSGKSSISPSGKSSIEADTLPADTLPHSKPSPPAQAREGVFVVHADGRIIPKIPIIPTPEKPEIPAQPAPRPAKKSTKKSDKKPDQDWQRWVDRYNAHAAKHTGCLGHQWNGAQFSALKALRAHLVKISTKTEGMTDDDCGFGAWCYVLENWERLDDWQRGQFDLCVLLKKITDILNRLKHGTQTNRAAPAGGAKLSASAARDQALRDY